MGFIKLGGFFVAFMSGNSTQLAVGLARGAGGAVTAAWLVSAFVLGVISGSLAGRISARQRRRIVLLLVATLLAGAAGLGGGGTIGAATAMAMAMGAENAVFEHEGDVHIGLTYMTGTLVKLGQRIAAALAGGDPAACLPYFLLWLGLILGATAGAALYPYLGLGGLWIAAAAALLLAAVIPEAVPASGKV